MRSGRIKAWGVRESEGLSEDEGGSGVIRLLQEHLANGDIPLNTLFCVSQPWVFLIAKTCHPHQSGKIDRCFACIRQICSQTPWG